MDEFNQADYDNAYQAGLDDMRERIVALIYDQYVAEKGYRGKDSPAAKALHGLILDIREDQAKESEAIQANSTIHEHNS